jgi:Domain of Unknown Function (DUF1080)
MRWMIFWLSIVLACTSRLSSESPFSVNESERELGFEPLVTDANLTGWSHHGNWKVEEGVVTRRGKGGDLTYSLKAVPDDFELRFEWKVAPGSNSGVYYRPGQYEYQILDNSKHADGKNPRTSAASLYFGMAPSHDATKPVGEWNEGRIVCKGSVIQHWLNGQKVLDFDYADNRWAKDVELLKVRGADVTARGAKLFLQDHGDPVWYRAIRMRAIPATETVQASTEFKPADIPAEMLESERQFMENHRKGK